MSKDTGTHSGVPSGEEKKSPEKSRRPSTEAIKTKTKLGRSLSVSNDSSPPTEPVSTSLRESTGNLVLKSNQSSKGEKLERDPDPPRSVSSPRQHSGMASSSPNIKTTMLGRDRERGDERGDERTLTQTVSNSNLTKESPAKEGKEKEGKDPNGQRKDMTKRTTTTKTSSKMTELKATFLDSFNRKKQNQPGELRSDGTAPLSGGRKHESDSDGKSEKDKEAKDKPSLLSLKSRGSEPTKDKNTNKKPDDSDSTHVVSAREGSGGFALGHKRNQQRAPESNLHSSSPSMSGSGLKRQSKSKPKMTLQKGVNAFVDSDDRLDDGAQSTDLLSMIPSIDLPPTPTSGFFTYCTYSYKEKDTKIKYRVLATISDQFLSLVATNSPFPDRSQTSSNPPPTPSGPTIGGNKMGLTINIPKYNPNVGQPLATPTSMQSMSATNTPVKSHSPLLFNPLATISRSAPTTPVIPPSNAMAHSRDSALLTSARSSGLDKKPDRDAEPSSDDGTGDVMDLSQLLGTSHVPTVTAKESPLTDRSLRDTSPTPSLFVTPLHLAFAARQDTDTSLLPLLRKNYDVYKSFINELDDKGNSLLHYAVALGQLNAVKLLLNVETILVDILNANGQTPLLVACIDKRYDIIALLLLFGASRSLLPKSEFSKFDVEVKSMFARYDVESYDYLRHFLNEVTRYDLNRDLELVHRIPLFQIYGTEISKSKLKLFLANFSVVQISVDFPGILQNMESIVKKIVKFTPYDFDPAAMEHSEREKTRDWVALNAALLGRPTNPNGLAQSGPISARRTELTRWLDAANLGLHVQEAFLGAGHRTVADVMRLKDQELRTLLPQDGDYEICLTYLKELKATGDSLPLPPSPRTPRTPRAESSVHERRGSVFAFESSSSLSVNSPFVYPLARLVEKDNTKSHPLIFAPPNSSDTPGAYLFRRIQTDDERSITHGTLKISANYTSDTDLFSDVHGVDGWVSLNHRAVLYRPGPHSDCNLSAVRDYYHQRGMISYCWGLEREATLRTSQARMGFLLRSNRPEVFMESFDASRLSHAEREEQCNAYYAYMESLFARCNSNKNKELIHEIEIIDTGNVHAEMENQAIYSRFSFLGLSVDKINSAFRNFVMKANSSLSLEAIKSGLRQCEWFFLLDSIEAEVFKIVSRLREGKWAIVQSAGVIGAHMHEGHAVDSLLLVLVQVIIDPYYRTLLGFCQLLRKDWFGEGFLPLFFPEAKLDPPEGALPPPSPSLHASSAATATGSNTGAASSGNTSTGATAASHRFNVKDYIATHTSPAKARDPLQTTQSARPVSIVAPSLAAMATPPLTQQTSSSNLMARQADGTASHYPAFFCLICVVTKLMSAQSSEFEFNAEFLHSLNEKMLKFHLEPSVLPADVVPSPHVALDEEKEQAVREYNTNSHYYLWGANELFHSLIRDSHLDNSSKYSSKGLSGVFGDFYRNLDNYAYAPSHYRNFGKEETDEESEEARDAHRSGVLGASGQNSTLAEANATTSNSSSGNAQLAIQRLILRGHSHIVNRTKGFKKALENFARDSAANQSGPNASTFGEGGKSDNKSEHFLQHIPFALAPSDIYYLRYAKSLEFNSLFLCSLPSRFAQLKNLASLNLSNCKFIAFPSSLLYLANLTYLNFSNNFLSEVPSFAQTQMASLRTLILDSNYITDLRPLDRLTQLTGLSLRSNQIQSIPPRFPTNKHWAATLSELNLAKNQLKYIPTHFFAQLTRLTKLDLSFNNLMRLPTVLGPGLGMERLTILYLSNNRLSELPMWLLPPPSQSLPANTNISTATNKSNAPVSGASSVKELNIAHNEFLELPRVVREMNFVQLLDASHNKINELPYWFGYLNKLKVVLLNNNALTTLPPLIRMQSLITLDLRLNSIQRLPSSLYCFFVNTANQLQLGAPIDDKNKAANKTNIMNILYDDSANSEKQVLTRGSKINLNANAAENGKAGDAAKPVPNPSDAKAEPTESTTTTTTTASASTALRKDDDKNVSNALHLHHLKFSGNYFPESDLNCDEIRSLLLEQMGTTAPFNETMVLMLGPKASGKSTLMNKITSNPAYWTRWNPNTHTTSKGPIVAAHSLKWDLDRYATVTTFKYKQKVVAKASKKDKGEKGDKDKNVAHPVTIKKSKSKSDLTNKKKRQSAPPVNSPLLGKKEKEKEKEKEKAEKERLEREKEREKEKEKEKEREKEEEEKEEPVGTHVLNLEAQPTVNFWDFSSEAVSEIVMKAFIRNNCLIFLTFNILLPSLPNTIKHWIQTVKSCNDRAQIVIALTHVEHIPSKETFIEILLAPVEPLLAKHQIVVTWIDQDDSEHVMGEVAEYFARNVSIKEELPLSGFEFLSVLRREGQLRMERNELPIITQDEMIHYAKICGLTSSSAIFRLLTQSHSAGLITYFQHHVDLRDVIVLDSRWLLAVFSKILSSPVAKSLALNGMVPEAKVLEMFQSSLALSAQTAPPVQLTVLLEKMEFARRVVMLDHSPVWFFRCLLSDKIDENLSAQLMTLTNRETKFDIQRVLCLPFVPIDFFALVVVKIVDLLSAFQFTALSVAKQNLIAVRPDTSTLLTISSAFLEEKYEFRVRVSSTNDIVARELFASAMVTLSTVILSFHNLQYQEFALVNNEMVNVEEFNFALTEGHARMPYRNGIVVDLFDVIPDRTCFKYKGVRFALQDFNIQRRIGCGSFAVVHCALTTKQCTFSNSDSASLSSTPVLQSQPSSADMTSSSSMLTTNTATTATASQPIPIQSAPSLSVTPSTPQSLSPNPNPTLNAIASSLPAHAGDSHDKDRSTVSSVSGELRERVVAIKLFHVLNKENSSAQEAASAYQDFMNEIVLQGATNHESILRVEGIVMKPPALIMPLCELGSLHEYLIDYTQAIPWVHRLAFSRHIAEGLKYLQGLNPPVAHLDMKSPNIMLTRHAHSSSPSNAQTIYAKIADFGSAVALVGKLQQKKVDNPRWQAPEILSRHPYDCLVDNYALGIVYWEIATRKTPYSDISFASDIASMVIAGGRPTFPTSFQCCPPQYRDMINELWHQDPSSRLSMEKAVAVLVDLERDALPAFEAIGAANDAQMLTDYKNTFPYCPFDAVCGPNHATRKFSHWVRLEVKEDRKEDEGVKVAFMVVDIKEAAILFFCAGSDSPTRLDFASILLAVEVVDFARLLKIVTKTAEYCLFSLSDDLPACLSVIKAYMPLVTNPPPTTPQVTANFFSFLSAPDSSSPTPDDSAGYLSTAKTPKRRSIYLKKDEKDKDEKPRKHAIL